MSKINKLTGNSNALRDYKKTISLNAIQKEVLVGTLLGDASIPFQKGKSTLCVQFAQTGSRAEYIQHLYDLFENFVGTPPRVYTHTRGARVYQSLQFRTFSHIDIKFYDQIFYGNRLAQSMNHEYKGWSRKKRVPKNLHELLTARSLAYWFMDDGTSYAINQMRYFVLNTQSLSFVLSDQGAKGVVQALSHNFGIHATIQKAKSYSKLYIRSKSTKRFVNLIHPYIQTCFAYKIQGPPQL